MHVDLVESLRCLREHELAWLVAVAEHVEGRDIVRGVLGCPECHAEYPIVQGVAYFAPAEPDAAPADASPTEGGAEAALVAAALLDLTAPGGFVVLAGSWGAAARDLLSVADGVHVLALNAPSGVASGDGLSLAVALGEVPVRPGTARGVALDDRNVSPRQLAAAAAALRAEGRLMAPASAPVPDGVSVLARDERYWVAERRAAGPVVRLTRGRGGIG